MICIVTPHAKRQFRRRLMLSESLAEDFFEQAVRDAGEISYDRKDGSAEIVAAGVVFIAKRGRNPNEVVAVTAWPSCTLNYSLLNAGSCAAG